MRSINVVSSLVLLVALVAVPTFAGDRLPLWINGLTYLVLFASLSLLVWTSGQISLCHIAFAAVGASTMSHLVSAGVPWLLSLVLSALAVVPIGLVVAIPAMRLSGVYLALATLGFGIFMQNVVYSSSFMFGGDLSAVSTRPDLGPITASSDRSLYFVALAVALVVLGLVLVVTRGRLGRLLRGLSESPNALTTHGLGVVTLRLLAFSLSAAVAGVAGALTITQFGTVSSASFVPLQSITLLAALAVCGTRVVRSPLLAALLVGVMPGYVDSFDSSRQSISFGTAAIVAALLVARRSEVAAWLEQAAASGSERRRRSPTRRPQTSGSIESAPRSHATVD